MRVRPVWVGCLLFLGCRTLPELPRVDLAQPGWQVRQGQAIWKPSANAPELSGELVWAVHQDGRFLLQFLKTPITLVDAQGGNEQWQISFPPQGRTIKGPRGRAPSQRLGWLQLAEALKGQTPNGWEFVKAGERWKLSNKRTGETIEGYSRP